MAQPVVMALFSPLPGRLSDRIEPRVVASLGMGLCRRGLFLFTFLGQRLPSGFIIGGLMLLGFGFALFSSPNTNAVMSSIERRFYGVGSATLGTMRLTGQMLSMGIAMVIFALHIGSAPDQPGKLSARSWPRVQNGIHPFLRPLFRRHLRIARTGKGEVTHGQKKIPEACGIDRRRAFAARGLGRLAEAAESAARPDLVVAHGASPEKLVTAADRRHGRHQEVHLPRRHRRDQAEHRLGPDPGAGGQYQSRGRCCRGEALLRGRRKKSEGLRPAGERSAAMLCAERHRACGQSAGRRGGLYG